MAQVPIVTFADRVIDFAVETSKRPPTKKSRAKFGATLNHRKKEYQEFQTMYVTQ